MSLFRAEGKGLWCKVVSSLNSTIFHCPCCGAKLDEDWRVSLGGKRASEAEILIKIMIGDVATVSSFIEIELEGFVHNKNKTL